jgi:hypothetical protein
VLEVQFPLQVVQPFETIQILHELIAALCEFLDDAIFWTPDFGIKANELIRGTPTSDCKVLNSHHALQKTGGGLGSRTLSEESA